VAAAAAVGKTRCHRLPISAAQPAAADLLLACCLLAVEPKPTYVLFNYAFTDNFDLAGGPRSLAPPAAWQTAPAACSTAREVPPGRRRRPRPIGGHLLVRAKGSLVKADSITPGFAFGHSGNATTQGSPDAGDGRNMS
jgi:hypothetical protein